MIYVRRQAPPKVFVELAERENAAAVRFYRQTLKRRGQRTFEFKAYRHPLAVEALTQQFHGKCSYCESRLLTIQPIEIDRHRPKARAVDLDGSVAPDHYWWLAAEWTNLLPVCANCNRNKGTRFPTGAPRAPVMTFGAALRKEAPLLLDPCSNRPERHLVFAEDGLVHSDTDRGQVTIEVLGLNRVDLVEARRAARQALALHLSLVDVLLPRLEANPGNAVLRGEIEERMRQVRRYLKPEQEYGALHRQVVNRWLHDVGIHESVAVDGQPLVEEATKKARLVSVEEERETADRFMRHAARQQSYSVEGVELDEKVAFFAGAKRIEWIEIENFRAIARLALPFPAPRSENEPWLMMLGENGTGKSSVLQAIAIALMGEAHALDLALDAGTFVRLDAGRRPARVQVKLTNIPDPIVVRFKRSSPRFTFETPDPKLLLLGYGSTRLLSRRRARGGDSEPGYIRVKNLFDPRAPLDDVESWLLDRREVPDTLFDEIAVALKSLLLLDPDDRFERETDQVVAIIDGAVPVALRQLSDGLQSVVAFSCDIMKSLLGWWTSVEDAEGVVLIDELEAHLHPAWKIELVTRLRQTFPRVAFLVSTHDPLCLKGLHEGEIVVLRRDEQGQVVALTDVPPVNDLRADQILTSPLFGLHTTRGHDATDAIERYAELLGRDERTVVEEDELFTLRQRLEGPLAAGETERQRAIDDVIWRTLVDSDAARSVAHDEAASSTPEELELRRRLTELLGGPSS